MWRSVLPDHHFFAHRALLDAPTIDLDPIDVYYRGPTGLVAPALRRITADAR